jgi:hypothetical protein
MYCVTRPRLAHALTPALRRVACRVCVAHARAAPMREARCASVSRPTVQGVARVCVTAQCASVVTAQCASVLKPRQCRRQATRGHEPEPEPEPERRIIFFHRGHGPERRREMRAGSGAEGGGGAGSERRPRIYGGRWGWTGCMGEGHTREGAHRGHTRTGWILLVPSPTSGTKPAHAHTHTHTHTHTHLRP